MTFVDELERGILSQDLISMLKSSSQQSYNAQLSDIAHGSHNNIIMGMDIDSPAGIYHPDIASSSQLFIRSILSDHRDEPYDYALDVGCGSGVLGLTLAKLRLAKTIAMVDIDEKAVDATWRNLRKNNELLSDATVHVWQSDLLDSVSGVGSYNCILFNMPLKHAAPQSEFESTLCDEGAKISRRFFEQAIWKLNEQGDLWFSYSNLSCPTLLKDIASSFHLKLMRTEMSNVTGVCKFIYKAQLKSTS
jgi:16S rRNA G1207 methylase RsmC